MVVQFYEYSKYHLKMVNFMVCDIYLNKAAIFKGGEKMERNREI